jgi:hypothetical protein
MLQRFLAGYKARKSDRSDSFGYRLTRDRLFKLRLTCGNGRVKHRRKQERH